MKGQLQFYNLSIYQKGVRMWLYFQLSVLGIAFGHDSWSMYCFLLLPSPLYMDMIPIIPQAMTVPVPQPRPEQTVYKH